MSHIGDAARYIAAQLETEMYTGKRMPYAGLMTLLAKLGIKSAMLDNRPFNMSSMQNIIEAAAARHRITKK